MNKGSFSKCMLGLVFALAGLSPKELAAQSERLMQSVSKESSDELQRLLSEIVIPVSTLDSANDDFTDLEPLVKAIGSAHVVQLGETSHGAGTDFQAKVRLVKFLHKRMGFDVLVWEAGMHGMQQVNASLRSGGEPTVAGQLGIFTIWSNAEEVSPLFEYVKASQSTDNPITLAGFDPQFTAAGSGEAFANDLRLFVSKIVNPSLRRSAQTDAEAAIAAYAKLWPTPTKADFSDLDNAVRHLLEAIDDYRPSFEQVHSARKVSFMEQALKNLRSDGAGKFDLGGTDNGAVNAQFKDKTRYFNRRDEQSFRNLRWIVDKGYPGHKVIVWAHNVHIINAAFEPDFRGLHAAAHPGDMVPTGIQVAKWLGDKAYTIGFTSYSGETRWVTNKAITMLPDTGSGSLEERLHALGHKYAFLDIRKAGNKGSQPLRKPITTRLFVPAPGAATGSSSGIFNVPDITKAFDALFFIDRTLPATPIARSGLRSR